MPQLTHTSLTALCDLLGEQNTRLRRLEEELGAIHDLIHQLHSEIMTTKQEHVTRTAVLRRIEGRVDRRLTEKLGAIEKRVAGIESGRR